MSHELFIICWEQQLAEVGMGQVPLGGTAYQLCWQPASVVTEEGEPGGRVPLWEYLPLQKHPLPPVGYPMILQKKTPISSFVLFLQCCHVNVCFMQEFAF